MPLLKDDASIMGRVRGTLASIPSEIGEIDSIKAKQFTDWLLDKAKYFRKHNKRERLQKLPDSIQRGDIVWVQFGINVGDEFSDDGTDGHFSLIWGQQGFMFIAIPLSKQTKVSSNGYTVNLGKIPGLPEDTDTYAKLDLIRSVSIRRIQRINGQEDGKITIKDPEVLQRIKDKFKEKFVDDDVKK